MDGIFEYSDEQYTVDRRAPKKGELYKAGPSGFGFVLEARQDFTMCQDVLTPVRFFDAYWYGTKIRLFRNGTVQLYCESTGDRLKLSSFEAGLLRAIFKLKAERPQCKPKPPTIQECALACRQLLDVLSVNVTRRSGMATRQRNYKNALDTLEDILARAEEEI